MGRVAKYKKVKSFDPYSKKNRGNIDLPTVGVWGLGDDGRRKKKRSLKAEKLHAKKNRNKKSRKGYDDGGFDAPILEKDEFDMADLTGSVKRQQVDTKSLLGSSTSENINSKPVKANSSKNEESSSKDETNIEKVDGAAASSSSNNNIDDDELKVARMLRLDKQLEQKAEEAKHATHGRMEGESKRAYAKRTRAETRQIIKESTTTPKNVEKLQKKKEFLKNKKKRKKGGLVGLEASLADFDDEGPLEKDFSAPPPEAVFGEQAVRPPIFRAVPRGASKKKSTATVKTTKGMTEQQVEAEKDAMEIMRRRIQAQYRSIRSNRQNSGFHL